MAEELTWAFCGAALPLTTAPADWWFSQSQLQPLSGCHTASVSGAVILLNLVLIFWLAGLCRTRHNTPPQPSAQNEQHEIGSQVIDLPI